MSDIAVFLVNNAITSQVRMLVTLVWPILRNAALLAVLTLPGQTDSLVIDTTTHQDHQPATGGAVRNETDSGTPVPITRLNPRPCPSCPFADTSGIKDKLRLVITDSDAWRNIWKVINETKLQLPILPEIDFSREMVVVVGLGQKPSGGYSILVDRAYEANNQLDVNVVSRSPGRSCLVPTVLTQVVDVVRLPRIEHSVVFHETEIVHECK